MDCLTETRQLQVWLVTLALILLQGICAEGLITGILSTSSSDLNYTIYEQAEQWPKAYASCLLNSGSLAKVDTNEKQIFIENLLDSNRNVYLDIDIWIGLVRENSSDMTWLDGSSVSPYSNWFSQGTCDNNVFGYMGKGDWKWQTTDYGSFSMANIDFLSSFTSKEYICEFTVIPGVWSTWAVGACSVPCGGGTETRTRTCTDPAPANGGSVCSGDSELDQDCNVYVCPVDGGWSTWGSYSACSVTCDGGRQTRSRTCDNPAPAYNGNSCPESSVVEQSCNTFSCPVDGVWGTWGQYSTCSATCGGGTETRYRTCDDPAPAYGGSSCPSPASSEEQQDCNQNACPVIPGGWSTWAVGACSVPCGGGTQTRTRTCTDPAPANGGSVCSGDSELDQDCNVYVCPVDGVWSTWGSYSTCSVSCGGGTETRYRTCTDPAPAYGGSSCPSPASNEDKQDCNTNGCPVDGDWSTWGSYSTCSVSCGGGTETRYRTCTDPAPAYGGSSCPSPASNEDKQDCNTNGCPETTTDTPTTTDSPTTTDTPTTTDSPTTTDTPTTTDSPTTTDTPTTTDSPTTTDTPTTTDSPTTTDTPTTTDSPTTTDTPTTTDGPTTTDTPTTTDGPTTTDTPTTTDGPTTTETPTTTDSLTSTYSPTTTDTPTNTNSPTNNQTTTDTPITTNNPTTSDVSTTTDKHPTTEWATTYNPRFKTALATTENDPAPTTETVNGSLTLYCLDLLLPHSFHTDLCYVTEMFPDNLIPYFNSLNFNTSNGMIRIIAEFSLEREEDPEWVEESLWTGFNESGTQPQSLQVILKPQPSPLWFAQQSSANELSSCWLMFFTSLLLLLGGLINLISA